MKVAIRLQNHGCANHPYWWIVIAPNRKNIKGRIIQHVGYWSPRHGVSLQRQIILNIPRIKHWMSCGAVPTYRIQRFLALWKILPLPWYYKKTQEELLALKKPQSQMTDKEKMKQQRKKKKRQREKASPLNYYKYESKFKAEQFRQFHKYRTKLKEKIQAAEYENQILRQLLVHNEYFKINRINQLSGNVVYDDTQELMRLQQQLAKAKAQLALIDKSFQNASILQKIKVMKEINGLVDKIRQAEKQRKPFREKQYQQPITQNITKSQLDKKLQYELVIKKIEKMNQQMIEFQKLCQPVTLQEYANYLVMKSPNLDPQNALDIAQNLFIERGKKGFNPLTKWELQYENQFLEQDYLIDAKQDVEDFERNKKNKPINSIPLQPLRDSPLMTRDQKQDFKQLQRKVTEQNFVKILMTRPDVLVPTNRPVHPFPDFNTYVPEQYYDPITHIDLDMTPLRSLQPRQQLDRYHQKKQYKNNENKRVKAQKISVQKKIKRIDHIL